MSEFRSVKVDINDAQVLIEVLKSFGLKPKVHKEPVILNNRFSSKKLKAHIVVEKKEISSYGDLGFEKVGGSYVCHYDQDGRMKPSFEQIRNRYIDKKLKKIISRQANYRLVSSEEDDEKMRILVTQINR